MDNKQEVSEPPYDQCAYGDTTVGLGQLIDIIETVYRGASKGRGLVVSPKGVSMTFISAFHVRRRSWAMCIFRLFDSVPILESTLSCV